MSEQKKLQEFGLSKEDIESISKFEEYAPVLKLSDFNTGDSLELKFLADKPEKIKYMDNGKEESFLACKVMLLKKIIGNISHIDLNYIYMLPLSAKTILYPVMRFYEVSNSLKDMTINITVDTAELKKFGESRVYRIVRKQ